MNEHNKDIFQDPVYSKKVIEMLTVANEYCLFVEKAEEYKKQDILEYLQKLIPIIYLKVALLPEVEVTDDSAAEHFVTEEQWESMFNTLHQKFGDGDIYYSISPVAAGQEIVKASLAENLADIYQDMKDFVLLYQKPLQVSKENAVHDCKSLFESRTGNRMVDVLRVIHYILFHESEADEFSDTIMF